MQRFDIYSSLTGKIALGCLVSSVSTARMFCPVGFMGVFERPQSGQTSWMLLGCPVLWTHRGKVSDDLLNPLSVTWPCSILHLPLPGQIDVKANCGGVYCFNQKARWIRLRTEGLASQIKPDGLGVHPTLYPHYNGQSDSSPNTYSHLSAHKRLGASCTSGCIWIVTFNNPQQNYPPWVYRVLFRCP